MRSRIRSGSGNLHNRQRTTHPYHMDPYMGQPTFGDGSFPKEVISSITSHDDYLKVQSTSSEVGDTLGCFSCVSDTGCWMLSVPGVLISFSLHGFCCLVFSWDTLGNASANSCSKAHQWQLALQIASQARDGPFDAICMYGIYLSWILTLSCFLGRLLVVQYVSIIPTQIDFVFSEIIEVFCWDTPPLKRGWSC